uniref:hypothetical protein n=1 Tax=Escherichia coli TaxID=562 RepID=UPI0020358282|nr:hypothetical protein [Escherichia coli]
MNLNERSTSAATPDLSRLYLISGRIMFDDDDQAYPVEADSPVMQRRLFGIILPTVPTT